MGFLSFLTRKTTHDASSERSFRPSSRKFNLSQPVSRPVTSQSQPISTTPDRRRQSRAIKPFLVGVRDSSGISEWSSPLNPHVKTEYSRSVSRLSYLPSDASSLRAMTLPRSGVRHVDLLDAQGLRPYDFRSRVQAAGARDYGEDVAERNVGENGVDVTSAASKAFYEKQRVNPKPAPRPQTKLHLEPRMEEFKLRSSNMRRTMSLDAKSLLSTPTTVNPRCDSGLGMRDGAITPTRPSTSKRAASLRGDTRGRPWISTESPQSDRSGGPVRLTQDSAQDTPRSASPPAIPRYRSTISMSASEATTIPVPDRRSSLFQGTYTCSTPTTEYSDASTGRPQSRHTATTSIDSMRKVGDEKPYVIHATPVVTRETPTSDIMDVELECLTSDFSDVDSFTEKRRQILDDDESLLFKDRFGDLGDKLPGLAGESDVAVDDRYDFWQSRRSRLRALGFDYDTDDSDEPRPSTAPAPAPSRASGRLRRVVRLDKKIDEDSEEEEMPYVAKVRRAKVARTAYLDDGNAADIE